MTPRLNEFGQPIGFPLPGWSPPPWPAKEPIQGRYCQLEPIDPDRHAAALFAVISDEADASSWTYMPYGPFETLDSYLEWMRIKCLGNDPIFYVIVDLKTSHPVGVASYLRITPASGFIEVGHLHFSAKLRRTPVATEAMFLMMRYAFELGYRRYEWKCDSLNAPSRAAAQRLGLSFEGIFRQATVYKQRSRDTAWFAAIDADWPDLKIAFETWLHPDNFDADGQQRISLSELTRPLLKNRG
ncbi:MAG: GNAT family N-acetyltransferase [Planctomycetes bacterium]|nr:GNAT family N-acetyltransferase [Planctomycetota bacterium]